MYLLLRNFSQICKLTAIVIDLMTQNHILPYIKYYLPMCKFAAFSAVQDSKKHLVTYMEDMSLFRLKKKQMGAEEREDSNSSTCL